MTYCFDSSAVVKRYAPERRSAWVKTIVQPTSGNSVYLALIGVVEIASAFGARSRPLKSFGVGGNHRSGCGEFR